MISLQNAHYFFKSNDYNWYVISMANLIHLVHLLNVELFSRDRKDEVLIKIAEIIQINEIMRDMLKIRPQYYWQMNKLRTMVADVLAPSHDDVIVTGHLCGEFTGPRWIPTQRPVTRSFDVFFDLRLNKRLSKQSWSWWFETLYGPITHGPHKCTNICWLAEPKHER